VPGPGGWGKTAQKPDDEGEIRGVQRQCAVFCASLMLDRRFTRGIPWNFDSRRLHLRHAKYGQRARLRLEEYCYPDPATDQGSQRRPRAKAPGTAQVPGGRRT
jgi:hypothetical protein